ISRLNNYVERLASQGWSKDKYSPGQSKSEQIANILFPFDILERDKNRKTQKKTHNVATPGNALIRTGMTNVDSTRSNLVDQVNQAILFARKNIYIKAQFLFDRNVILALIRTKQMARMMGQDVDIKIILDPLPIVTPQ